MILNEGQKQAIEIISQRYKKRQPYSVLVGPAGTGKTSSVSFIIQNLGLNPSDVAYLAPTGKASQVLKRKGNPDAQTLHKFLYNARRNKKGQWYFEPKEELDFYPSLIVADEASMIDPRIWKQLLTHRIPVLALGDKAQLSPVAPEANNHLLDHPHAELTEIMRQAGDNEIIDLATKIRTGYSLNSYRGAGKQVKILDKKELNIGLYEWGSAENSQILCALNETRRQGNRFVRELKGYNPERPEIGDCVIGLKNHWDFLSLGGEPFTNGIMGRILDYRVENVYLPKYIHQGKYQLMIADILTEDGDTFKEVPIDYHCLVTGQKVLNDTQEMKLSKVKDWDWGVPFELDYSYFTSTWKAQGSEWNNVLVFEENFPYDFMEHRRFLYTSCTRAAQRLVIIKK